jgi:2,3-bisphosphoglycerate-dependent phosphoglycerate mutase
MTELVLLRHGESTWNEEDRFTGWTDVELTGRGIHQAIEAGRLLRSQGRRFDRVFTSLLRRTIKTAWLVMEEMDLMWIPLQASWRLNERHYGALQGMSKAETIARYGAEQVARWRRSYEVRPPMLRIDDERFPGQDAKYASLRPEDLPLGESLKDTSERVLKFWAGVVTHSLEIGQRVLIVSHGNTIRAIVKHLDNLSDDAIEGLDIPTGKPIVYQR